MSISMWPNTNRYGSSDQCKQEMQMYVAFSPILFSWEVVFLKQPQKKLSHKNCNVENECELMRSLYSQIHPDVIMHCSGFWNVIFKSQFESMWLPATSYLDCGPLIAFLTLPFWLKCRVKRISATCKTPNRFALSSLGMQSVCKQDGGDRFQ